MKKIRVIPRLDIKNDTVVKGIHMEGLRVVGRPSELAHKYYMQGADELLYLDAVASLYERNSLTEIIRKAAESIFIPLTVGGGIRNLDDISEILSSGADKVAINTAAVKDENVLRKAVRKFGSQCIVLSVQAKKIGDKKWEAYTETGREKSGKDVVEWIKRAISLGVGEVLLTSIDREGTKSGFDLNLISEISHICQVPLIVCGGAGKLEHSLEVIQNNNVDAVAIASALHYDNFSIDQLKNYLNLNNIPVRI